eukprot:TRINITY_DN6707_c0_g2_i3.p1 TRINITY_DN6707_c0_g2~~TRINITY_DN6707_c0_g2_i3.p1  ORF type:complete len:457 (-),score=89.90 TRINITY_DN6707_c0_g2_i3:353-1723(-)
MTELRGFGEGGVHGAPAEGEAEAPPSDEFTSRLLGALLQQADSREDLLKIAADYPRAPVGTFLRADPTEELVAICAEFDQRFVDPLLPPTAEGFFLPSAVQEGSVGRFEQWGGPLQREPEATRRTSCMEFLRNSERLARKPPKRVGTGGLADQPLGDFKQGEWGSCKLTSFVAALAAHEQHAPVLQHVLQPMSSAALKHGVAVLRVWCRPLGQWRWMVMDDFVPHKLLGSSKSPGQPQYTLIEKSWVKASGGFLALDDSLFQDGSDSSGSESSGSDSGSQAEGPEDEDLSFVDIMPYVCLGFEPMSNFGLHVGWQGPDKTPAYFPASSQECFTMLQGWVSEGHIGCLSGFDSTEGKKLGIYGGHDYSLLRVEQVGDCQLMQLRNPWSHSCWKGKFRSGDEESWTPALRAALGVEGAGECKGGRFWIPADQVFKHFEGGNRYTRNVQVLPMDDPTNK